MGERRTGLGWLIGGILVVGLALVLILRHFDHRNPGQIQVRLSCLCRRIGHPRQYHHPPGTLSQMPLKATSPVTF
jgi:hypothetical protein